MNRRILGIPFVCLLLAGASLALAQDDAMKQRFLDRKPTLDAWKAQGRIGENNEGRLEAREALTPPEQQTLAAENADRESVYQGIASQVGSTVLDVAKRRAVQIAAIAAPGHWLQHPDGHWYQKQ
ncbi:MAG TPA: YdbL family protein [Candidatus Aminicenantes bacterium]|nr:YdbL family protein [Candidatus Aminicenantes bacterium]